MKIHLFVLLLVGLIELFAQTASGGDVQILMGDRRLTKEVKSFKELRQEGVVLQGLDYSCGAAALATLLSYFFRDRTAETDVIGFILIHGQTPEEGLKKYFRRHGFSLLDLKRFVEFRGYKSAGYKSMDLNDLMTFVYDERVPVLVPINPLGYNHFVIVRAVAQNRIFLADPALGKTTMTIARFLSLWVDGVGFIVTKKPSVQISMGAIASDAEMDQITAAGVAVYSRPPGASSAPPSTVALSPSLLQIGAGEEVPPEIPQIMSVIQRQASGEFPRVNQTYTDTLSRGLLDIFELQNFSGGLQLGQPAGNFVDFTPPKGQPISIRPGQ